MQALNEMRSAAKGTMLEWMGVELLELSPERVIGRMAITPSLHQPFGLLHGGASVALAETVASLGGWMNIDQDAQMAVGLEINANHLRAMRTGTVTATATPAHLGRRTQVWEVRIVDERERLVCLSRCTLAVVPKPQDGDAAVPERGA